MRLIIVGFCIGVVSLAQFPEVPPYLIVLGTGGLIAIVAVKWPVWLLSAGFCFGLALASWDAQVGLDTRLAYSLEGEQVTARFKIKGLPQEGGIGEGHAPLRFTADVISAQGVIGKTLEVDPLGINKVVELPARVRLSWYGAPEFIMRPDQEWQLTVKLKRPHGFANLGGFDYERWLFHKGIGATGTVVSSRRENVNELSNRLIKEPMFSIDRLRQEISSEIQTRFKSYDSVGLLPALVVGDRSYMTSEQWDVLRATGTSHLFAISGLHIGFLAGLFYAIANLLWRRLGWGISYVPAPIFAAVVGLLAALVYAAAAGFSLPTLRALLMLAVLVLFGLFGRQTRVFDGLLGAAFLVLLIFPRSSLDVGFWLSFSAVAIIFWAMSGRIGVDASDGGNRVAWRQKIWQKFIAVQWVVFVGLAPLLIAMFGEISVVSPLVNIIAVPVVSLIIVPLALIGALFLFSLPPVGNSLIELALWVFDWSWRGLEWVVRSSPASYPLPDVGLLASALLMVGAIILLAPKAVPYKYLVLFAFLPFLFPDHEGINAGQLKLTVFDVGHGLSVFARTQNHSLIFDTGNRFSATRDAGESVILPYLKQKGVSYLDKIILSHKDSDHVGGANSLIAGITTLETLMGPQVDVLTGESTVSRCVRGKFWIWDEIKFEVLFPVGPTFDKPNNRSCVLKISGKTFSILLPGDIERPAEEYLLRHYKSELAADLLIAPHHGSGTSSTTGFINAVDPRQVVFTAGYRDRFGHPTAEVINRYEVRSVKWWNTADTGTIEYDFGADESWDSPSIYRRHHPAYWRE